MTARGAAPALAALAALWVVALAGCETTADKSARLEREAERRGGPVAAKGLSITRPSRTLKVSETALVAGSEGAAAVVTIRNTSARAAADVPIQVTAKRPGEAAAVYTNTTPGLGHALVAVGSIPAHGELSWVDDQLPAAAAQTKVTATVGDGAALAAAPPALSVSGTHEFEDPTNGLGLEGNVSNRSATVQQQLAVFAVARKGRAIVAAGRAIVPEVAAGASARFQLFWVGSAKDARVQVFAPATIVR